MQGGEEIGCAEGCVLAEETAEALHGNLRAFLAAARRSNLTLGTRQACRKSLEAGITLDYDSTTTSGTPNAAATPIAVTAAVTVTVTVDVAVATLVVVATPNADVSN